MTTSDERITAERQLCIQLSRMLGRPVIEIDPGPAQSREMALATGAMTEADIGYKTQPDVYFTIGYVQMTAFMAHLEAVGLDLASVKTVLEFGCGSARLLRLLRSLPGARLIGTDMNPDCIEWCREQIPGLEFHLNQRQPPLTFLDDNSVDLILAQSVFTHIPLTDQVSWLKELRRALSPGGVLLCTVSGEEVAAQQLDGEQVEALARDGQLTLDAASERLSLSSRVTGQLDVYQTPERVREVFGSVFDILTYTPSWQDVLVLRKPG